jgi:type III pantothenate kinase
MTTTMRAERICIHMTKPDAESLIAVVVGNTSIGLGVFSPGESGPVPAPRRTLSVASHQSDFRVLAPLLPESPAAWHIASVYRAAADRLRAWVSLHRRRDSVRLLRNEDFPIRVDVDVPERVGADRLAGAVAAQALRARDHSAIVVDAGTAITVNAISTDGRFLGGAILPGRQMTATALCASTDLLPMVELGDAEPTAPPIGRSTPEAIRSGLYWGTLGALGRLIDEMRKPLGEPLDLFLTGGGMADLVAGFGADARFVPDLVLRGIALASIDRQTDHIRCDR